jgi:hypothetical protein
MAEPTPTYYTKISPDGMLLYNCILCENDGTGHWAEDWALFTFHMNVRHDGQIIEFVPDPPELLKDETTPQA